MRRYDCRKTIRFAILLVGAMLCVCARFATAANDTVVVTTSMLAAAARDAAGGEVPFRLVRLIPPGNCPGHFDLKPRMLERIRNARVFIYHNYQRGIEKKISGLDSDAHIMVVAEEGSYLVPINYWDMVATVRKELSEQMPYLQLGEDGGRDDEDGFQNSRDKGIAAAEDAWRKASQKGGWQGKPVLAAAMQADFCRWLGFEVAALIPRPDAVTPKTLSNLIETEAEMVVANSQTGTAAARMLAERKGIPVAVLSNFPGTAGGQENAYERLWKNNLQELERAWRQR